jgi:histidine triad (HIT) family protein
MADSIFTKIIKGEIPSHKVYEDELTFAFLDIHPKTPGHVLVIPKKQVDLLWDLSDEDYQAVMAISKKLAF